MTAVAVSEEVGLLRDDKGMYLSYTWTWTLNNFNFYRNVDLIMQFEKLFKNNYSKICKNL